MPHSGRQVATPHATTGIGVWRHWMACFFRVKTPSHCSSCSPAPGCSRVPSTPSEKQPRNLVSSYLGYSNVKNERTRDEIPIGYLYRRNSLILFSFLRFHLSHLTLRNCRRACDFCLASNLRTQEQNLRTQEQISAYQRADRYAKPACSDLLG